VGLGYELGEFLGHRHAQLRPQTITEREREVLQLAAEGRTGREIAAELGIGPATVKTHFENLYLRLQASDKASAVAEGLRLGLID
jgi:DNA-binding CsgD family transcriptional regulator